MGGYRWEGVPFTHLYLLLLEIAKSLAKCVLHFNTFGGNPMACAIGSAVLEVRASSHVNVIRVTERQPQSHTHILITLSHHSAGEEG